MHFEFNKVAWKIVIAFTVNGILLGLFLICKISPHTATSSPSLRLRLISVILRHRQEVRTVDDINQAKTGLPEGILPTGHQTGTSFQEHGNVQVRNKLLKRYGGSEKRNPLFKRHWHISLWRPPPNGSWGSLDSFKMEDAAALSSLALLAFFTWRKFSICDLWR